MRNRYHRRTKGGGVIAISNFIATHTQTVEAVEKKCRDTCGEDHVLGDEIVAHDVELGQLDALHPGDGVVAAAPVELNVIRCVAIWNTRTGRGRVGGGGSGSR